jgi:hypothetical protein
MSETVSNMSQGIANMSESIASIPKYQSLSKLDQRSD